MAANLTEIQKLRMAIVANLDFDVEKAKKVYNFVTGDGQTPASFQQRSWSDGVYYVVEGGCLAGIEDPDSIAEKVIGVAVKMGDKIATVALHNAAGGEEVSLTNGDACGTSEFFHQDFYDAITDWDGEGNTKDYGNALNPEIALEEGQYIPSLAQLHLILLNIKEVNTALEAVGGSPMRKEWYWSSTEYSANGSWYVHFGSGYSGSTGKYGTYVVRPAVALSV